MAKPLDFLHKLREAVTQSATPKYYEVALNIPAANESLAAFDEALKSVSYISLIPNDANSFETNLSLLKSVPDASTIILKEANGKLIEIFTGRTITYKTQRNGIIEIHKGESEFIFAIVKESDRVDKERVKEYMQDMNLTCMEGYLSILKSRADRNIKTIEAGLAERLKRKK